MSYKTVYKDILFVEGRDIVANIIQEINVDLSFKFGAQLKSLRDVKDLMVLKANEQHCNCIVDFKYGQKSRWLAIDDVAFWGRGFLARIELDEVDANTK
ncbi:MAG: hypothetical protein K9L02_04765 [Acholeplasmataceae bacterium]|nr:hypothetical protein [Acholeplasmataceae bacterium]